ncbi:MAG: thioredoxin domain-containing protein, partial [Kangiellaceae bacterium]|nr:thioredoxin domain-containing protein [Kangiellaceae bacterium]
MSKQAIIFDVSDSSFKKYVVGNSDKVPVFVAFINIWSEPCMSMSDMFASLATEFAEEFVFAKVDIDENQQLKEQYKIENVPTLKVIVDGKVLASEEGKLSEDEARVLLKNFGITDTSEEMRIEARQLHLQGDTHQAITLLSQAMQKNPSNARIAMDMVQIFIDIGELDQANELFNRFPETIKNSETGLSLSGQIWIIEEAEKTAGLSSLNETILTSPDNFDA